MSQATKIVLTTVGIAVLLSVAIIVNTILV